MRKTHKEKNSEIIHGWTYIFNDIDFGSLIIINKINKKCSLMIMYRLWQEYATIIAVRYKISKFAFELR